MGTVHCAFSEMKLMLDKLNDCGGSGTVQKIARGRKGEAKDQMATEKTENAQVVMYM